MFISNYSSHIILLWQLFLFLPSAIAQSDTIVMNNPNRTSFLFQLGFGEDLTFAKNDVGGLAMLNNPVTKSEGQEIIPSFYVGFRINKKFGLQAAYNGIWKSTRGAAYAGSYFDSGWNYGDFGFLEQLFEAFGLEIPDDYAPSEPGWRNIADGLSWETWTDLYSLRLSYVVFENRRFRTSFLAGPAIAVSYESLSLNVQGIQQIGDYYYVNSQSEYFENRFTNLYASAGIRLECKFLRRMSLMAFADGGIPFTKPQSPEYSVEVMHYNEIKQLTSASHVIDTRSFRAGLGLLIGIVRQK